MSTWAARLSAGSRSGAPSNSASCGAAEHNTHPPAGRPSYPILSHNAAVKGASCTRCESHKCVCAAAASASTPDTTRSIYDNLDTDRVSRAAARNNTIGKGNSCRSHDRPCCGQGARLTHTRAVSQLDRTELRAIAAAHNDSASALRLPMDCWEGICQYLGYADAVHLSSTSHLLWRELIARDGVWNAQLRYFRLDMRELRGGDLLFTDLALPEQVRQNNSSISTADKDSIAVGGLAFMRMKCERQLYRIDIRREWHFRDTNAACEDNPLGVFSVTLRPRETVNGETSGAEVNKDATPRERGCVAHGEGGKDERQQQRLRSMYGGRAAPFDEQGKRGESDEGENAHSTNPNNSVNDTSRTVHGSSLANRASVSNHYTNIGSSDDSNIYRSDSHDHTGDTSGMDDAIRALYPPHTDSSVVPVGEPFRLHASSVPVLPITIHQPVRRVRLRCATPPRRGTYAAVSTAIHPAVALPVRDEDDDVDAQERGPWKKSSYWRLQGCCEYDEDVAWQRVMALSAQSVKHARAEGAAATATSSCSTATPTGAASDREDTSANERSSTIPSAAVSSASSVSAVEDHTDAVGAESTPSRSLIRPVVGQCSPPPALSPSPDRQQPHLCASTTWTPALSAVSLPNATLFRRHMTRSSGSISISPQPVCEPCQSVSCSAANHLTCDVTATATSNMRVRAHCAKGDSGTVSMKPHELLTLVDLMQHGTDAQASQLRVYDGTADEERVFLETLSHTLTRAQRRRLYLDNHHRALRNNGQTTRHRRGPDWRHQQASAAFHEARSSPMATAAAAAPVQNDPLRSEITLPSFYADGQVPPVNRILKNFRGQLLEIRADEAYEIVAHVIRDATIEDNMHQFTPSGSDARWLPQNCTRYFLAPELCVCHRIALLVVDPLRVLIVVANESNDVRRSAQESVDQGCAVIMSHKRLLLRRSGPNAQCTGRDKLHRPFA